jgi:hypothetical protein
MMEGNTPVLLFFVLFLSLGERIAGLAGALQSS